MRARVNSIDCLRGICLLNIFINHISVGVLKDASPSKYLLFDSADIFVFLAGVSVVLAYGSGNVDFGKVGRKLWKRAGHLYKVNLVVIAVSVLVLCIGPTLVSIPTLNNNPLHLVREHGIFSYLWHISTFQQSVGYSMVLRLYVLLMLVAPLYLWLASRCFWYPLIVAVPLWVFGSTLGLVESDTLTGTPLALTFLPWNLPFAMGIALGAAIIKGVAAPRSQALDRLALGIAVILPLGLVLASRVSPVVLEWLNNRNEHYLFGVSKTLQSPLRAVSLICTAFVIIRFPQAPVIRLLHQVNASNLFCRLGRNSLRVFAMGAVISLVIEQVLVVAHFRFGIPFGSTPAVGVEILFVMSGVLAMAWFAGVRSSTLVQSRMTSPSASLRTSEAA